MLSIIDKMDIKSWLRPLREGDMYEINGKNYYNEELLFDHLPKTDEFEEDEDEREDKDEREDEQKARFYDLAVKLAEARNEASLLRTAGILMQCHGVQFPFNDHPFPWEGQEENENG